ncbi:hypothetical protein NESM_000423800 [Novymonas esmeraldas]|uniref:T-cell immunomodulatory protein TIP C2 domain-containing protein n=1 Tax=Novymonas esmeraldas TaxID=1808958 RepID=A0AAW0EP92_9TRYP
MMAQSLDTQQRHGRRTAVGVPLALGVLCLAVALLSGAAGRSDDGVSLGEWVDATSTFFGAAGVSYVDANGTVINTPAPPLRVLALVDWMGRRRTALLGSWSNGSSLVLWANGGGRGAASAARLDSSDLVFRAAWTRSLLATGGGGGNAEREVVGAVAADLLGVGELSILVQASDGSLWAMNRSSAAASPPSPIAIDSAATVSTQLKTPSAPQVAVVPDRLSDVADPHTAQAALAFVNAEDQLVLLSRVAQSPAPQWPPRYVARVLVDERSGATSRAVLPFSIALADVDEDCAAELLYAVRDAQARRFEVFILGDAAPTVSGAAKSTTDAARELLLQLSEAEGERYGDAFALVDVDGDGLPELLLPVQRTNASGVAVSCAAADVAGVAEACTAYDAVRIFYPARAPGVTGAPSCRSPARSGGSRRLTYTLSASALVALTKESCGVQGWSEARSSVAAAELPLYMPSYPSAPLLLRPGDYNRDRRVDVVVPSSFGPLLLTSRAGADGRGDSAAPVICTAVDAAAGRAAVRAVERAAAITAELEGYRTATPFFATAAEVGQLDVVLVHHRRRASTADDVRRRALRIYRNSAVPSQAYFLSASALTGPTYGTASVGATHRMTWQDAHMRSHWATVTQLGHTLGHALLSPQVLVGLGETFSYVHGYTVGLRVSRLVRTGSGGRHNVADANASVSTAAGVAQHTQTVQRKEWPSYLVPNAAVFTQLTPVEQPAGWRLELYLPTSAYRALLVSALVVALVVIGLPVVWLRCGEMRQDYREWRTPL